VGKFISNEKDHGEEKVSAVMMSKANFNPKEIIPQRKLI